MARRATGWGDEPVMRATSSRMLLRQQHILFDGQCYNLPNPLVYINEDKHTHRDELHDILPLYAAGPEHKDDVVFGRYREPRTLE